MPTETTWVDRVVQYNQERFENQCHACELGNGQTVPIPKSFVYDKTGKSPLFIVLSYPKETDLQMGRILCGGYKVCLANWVSKFIYRPSMYITTAVKCGMLNEGNPSGRQIKACSIAQLNTELKIINPKVVVLVGKEAIRAFFHCTATDAKELLLTHTPSYSKFLDTGVKWTGSVYTTYHPSYFKMGGQTALEEEDNCIYQFNLAIKELHQWNNQAQQSNSLL